VAPEANGIQHAVTAAGGTQTGVETHSVSKPFTLTCIRPKTFKSLGPANPVTGYVAQVGRNRWIVITRKGVEINSAGQVQVATTRTQVEVPAGADSTDPANIRAMLSCHLGALWDASAGFGDCQVDGIL
jgi:hypothetical protein